MSRILIAAAAVALTAIPAAAAETKYALTGDNTKIEFVGTKKNGKHEGGFQKLSGGVTVGETGAKIEVEIDCDSIYTDDKKLTQHLKSGDFFAVKDHPKSTFKSTKVEKKDNGAVVTGTLAIRGKEKEISFPVEMQAGDTLVLKGEFKINRTDWGMTYGAGMIDDDVTIKVKVEAKK
jgi:polyisoprenoid-binding protein YceI